MSVEVSYHSDTGLPWLVLSDDGDTLIAVPLAQPVTFSASHSGLEGVPHTREKLAGKKSTKRSKNSGENPDDDGGGA